MSLKQHLKPAVATLTVGTGLLFGASPAFAAGGGYGPAPSPPTGVPGGFDQIVASQTVGPSGQVLTVSSGNQRFTLSVPAGTFSTPTQVTIYAPTDLSSVGGVAGLDIEFSNPSTGASVGQTLSQPISVTIHSSAIQPGDRLEIFTNGTFVPYPRGSVTAGQAVIEITQDPVFAVVPPGGPAPAAAAPATGSPATVPGATSVHTGEPFFGESIAGTLLVGSGAAGLVLVRRRRHRSGPHTPHQHG